MLDFAVFSVMNDSLLLKQTEDAELFSFLKKPAMLDKPARLASWKNTVRSKRHDRFQASTMFGCSRKRRSSLGR